MADGCYNHIYSVLVENEQDTLAIIAYSLYKRQEIEFIQAFKIKHDREPKDEDLTPHFHHVSMAPQLTVTRPVSLFWIFLAEEHEGLQMLRDIRCGSCNRLLARAGGVEQLQIKCSRCGTLNHVKALSLDRSPLSDLLTREFADYSISRK